MLRFLDWTMGTILVVLGILLLFAYLANDDFRDRTGEFLDELLGRQELSDQAVVYLSESVVEIEARGGVSGTGVIITEKLPWVVVTAEHVARNATGRVRRPGKAWGRAEVVETDFERDIASLRVNFASNVEPVLVTSPSLTIRQPDEGDLVAIRCYDTDILVGEVTAFVTRAGGHTSIVTNIASHPGCSGSPMVNAQGELVGIVTDGGGMRTLATPYP